MTVARSTILPWYRPDLNGVVKRAELRERARHATLDRDANRSWKIHSPAQTRYSRSEISAKLQMPRMYHVLTRQYQAEYRGASISENRLRR